VGPVNLEITADTPHYSVFENEQGVRTYLVFNPTASKIEVKFSDGTKFTAAATTLTKYQ
jgi:hypothetical protein